MSKVYCKNCIFNRYWGNEVIRYCARVHKALHIWNRYNDEYEGEVTSKVDFNENSSGKCGYYQRKWWKIWVSDYNSEKFDNGILLTLLIHGAAKRIETKVKRG